ncbi:hypothetical protein C0991_002692 [Blastosporella zonata]|nr:hypothetical protein C0991_002692 [Blastosporella zonata]
MEREMEVQGNITPPQPRRGPAASSFIFDPSSPQKDLETVSTHIRESLDKEEVERLCAMLQGETPEETEPFRFSANPSPAHGNTPYRNSSNSLGFSFGLSSTAAAPVTRKTLNRNPNGVYRWQGGGSAKTPRSRNRYSSPAFGPSQSTPDRLIFKDTQIGIPRSDTKRRKVADEPNPSSASSSSNSTILNGTAPKRAVGPDPSPTRVKQPLPFPVSAASPATPRPAGNASSNVDSSPSTSRLRVPPTIQKPTLPVVPSPLRQAWSGASPPSRTDGGPATPSSSKQTKAANYMAELIKEVTPPKRPDLSNPYQTASPLGKVGSAPKGRVGKRARATGKPAAPDSQGEKVQDNKAADKEKVYSTQAIIEATLPKGSKRSRPPAQFEKTSTSDGETLFSKQQSQAEPSTNHARSAFVEDDIDDDDEDTKRTTKKSKLAGHGAPAVRDKFNSSDLIIEEVEVTSSTPEKPQSVTSPPLASTSTSTALPGKSVFSGLKSTSAPKEPSKLRYSYQPETTGSPAPAPAAPLPGESAFSSLTSAPRPAPPAFPSFAPTPTPPNTSFSFNVPAPTSASSFTPSTFSFSSSAPTPRPASNSHHESLASALTPQQAALKVPQSSLPTFAFPIEVEVPNSAHAKAIGEAKSVPKASLTRYNFNRGALADIAAAKASTSTASASAPVVPFDWMAAGVKPPSNGSTWKCSVCALSSPLSATECEICETPRGSKPDAPPSVVPAPAPVSAPVVPFDWAACGAKPPASDGTGWICLLCSLSNPMSATEQCKYCETPRPAAPSSATSVPAPSTPAPAVQGFSWAAAGMKPPTAGAGWTCSLCGLSNPASVTDKCTICDAPRA